MAGALDAVQTEKRLPTLRRRKTRIRITQGYTARTLARTADLAAVAATLHSKRRKAAEKLRRFIFYICG